MKLISLFFERGSKVCFFLCIASLTVFLILGSLVGAAFTYCCSKGGWNWEIFKISSACGTVVLVLIIEVLEYLDRRKKI
jgi:hypothetical protein